MRLTSIVAIYLLFWSLSFFLVLPFRPGARSSADSMVPGQARGAPPSFSFARACGWTTIVSLVLFALYYANYVEGWVPVDVFNIVPANVLEGR